MIRIDAFVWVVVLALLGVGLFQVKYEVQAREAELRHVRKQIDANDAAIRVLEAEWSYLNDLGRLTDLTRRHTDLAPTTPDQIGRLADLPARREDAPAIAGEAPLLLSEEFKPTPEPNAEDATIDAILADMRGQSEAPEDMAVSAGTPESQ